MANKEESTAKRVEQEAKRQATIEAQKAEREKSRLAEMDARASKLNDIASVEVLTDHAIINGHELSAGTVVELSVSEIDNHRSHGLCLSPVADDDAREVFDVSQPPVSEEADEGE